MRSPPNTAHASHRRRDGTARRCARDAFVEARFTEPAFHGYRINSGRDESRPRISVVRPLRNWARCRVRFIEPGFSPPARTIATPTIFRAYARKTRLRRD